VAGNACLSHGRRPINIPKQLGNVWLSWAFRAPMARPGGGAVSGDFYADAANQQRIPGHALFNAGLRWTATDAVTIDLRGENLFNRFYAYTSGSNGVSGPDGGMWVLGAPRSYELALTAHSEVGACNGCTASQGCSCRVSDPRGLSGTAIAFYSELDRMLNPELYQVPERSTRELNADELARGVLEIHPGARIAQLYRTPPGRECHREVGGSGNAGTVPGPLR